MTRAILIRSLLGASSALAMTMCHATPEMEGPDERGSAVAPVPDVGTFLSATWNASIETSHAACIRVLVQPRLPCYNPTGSSTPPGISVILRQTLRSGTVARSFPLHSSLDLISIYNVASYANVELQLQFSSGAAALGCVTGLALSSIPAGIVTQATSKITFDPGAVWGGLGAPPAPFTDCNSTLYVTM